MNRIDHARQLFFAKQLLQHLICAIFFALFGAVYERFSHEVYSYYMLYAFAIPLVLGALPCSILTVLSYKRGDSGVFHRRIFFFWNCAVLTLTTGCVFRGVLDIYGTDSRLVLVYPIAGILLLTIACCLLITSVCRYRRCADRIRSRTDQPGRGTFPGTGGRVW